MQVLTIKQPWATLIMQGYKRFEFRSWQTKYRGDLLIHAGKGIDKEAIITLQESSSILNTVCQYFPVDSMQTYLQEFD